MFLLLMTTPIQEVAYGMSSDYLLSLARAHILSVPMLLSYLYHQITVCHTEEIFPHVVDWQIIRSSSLGRYPSISILSDDPCIVKFFSLSLSFLFICKDRWLLEKHARNNHNNHHDNALLSFQACLLFNRWSMCKSSKEKSKKWFTRSSSRENAVEYAHACSFRDRLWMLGRRSCPHGSRCTTLEKCIEWCV